MFLGLDQYGSDSEGDDSDQETVVNRISGFGDVTAEPLRVRLLMLMLTF